MISGFLRKWWQLMAAVVVLLLVATVVPNPILADVQARTLAPLPPQAAVKINFPNGGFTYSPANVTIAVGDEVEWQGAGGPGGDFTSHPLVSDEGLWPVQSSGTVFTFKFTQPGLYHFHCQIHGPIGMKGTVLVVGGQRTYLPLAIR